MGPISIVGAMIIIIVWFTLIEYDYLTETEQTKIKTKIKQRPLYMTILLLMPLGIIINILGGLLRSVSLTTLGATLIFLQGLIIAYWFIKRNNKKAIAMFLIIFLLGIFLYMPFFLS